MPSTHDGGRPVQFTVRALRQEQSARGTHLGAALDPIIAALPSGPGESRHIEDLDLDPDEFRPLPERYYRYEGSLTTPPCHEGVHWIVMAGTERPPRHSLRS